MLAVSIDVTLDDLTARHPSSADVTWEDLVYFLCRATSSTSCKKLYADVGMPQIDPDDPVVAEAGRAVQFACEQGWDDYPRMLGKGQ